MKRSLRTLEDLQVSLSATGGTADGSNTRDRLEERRLKDAARAQQLAKLSPYKRTEYLCLECVAELRGALRDVEELQFTLTGAATPSSDRRSSASREEREEEHSNDDDNDDDNDEVANDERAQLLGRRGGAPNQQRRRQRRNPPARRSGEAAVLEQELLRARQRARRAHQQLQQLQRESTRLAQSSEANNNNTAAAATAASTAAAATTATDVASTSTAALEALDWQRAERHVELAKQWYREVFGIHVVSSQTNTTASSSTLQLNRPAQPQQGPGSMSYFGRGANALPPGVASSSNPTASTCESAAHGDDGSGSGPSPWTSTNHETIGNAEGSSVAASSSSSSQALMLRSAREDAEFQEFFASVQANDELMDAALDRLSEGLARLLNNARGMQDELTIQAELLQGTETRINENEADIANMNRRLRRAIREMNDSSICVYVVCLLVLLLILGVLLRFAN